MKKKIFFGIIVIMITGLSILCPRYVLSKNLDSDICTVNQVSPSLYVSSSSALSKKSSMNLTSGEKTKLISGVWPSSYTECDISEGFIPVTKAVEYAKDGINMLYTYDTYPCSLSSTYDNWYSWDAHLYKYTDTNFNTYTAYLWDISFKKFNSDEYHKVLLNENGTILNIETNHSQAQRIIRHSNMSHYFNAYTVKVIQSSYKDEYSINYPSTDISKDDIQSSILITLNDATDSDDVVFYKYKKDDWYGFGFVPVK